LVACGGKPYHFRYGYRGQFIEGARSNLRNTQVHYTLKYYRKPRQWPMDDLLEKPPLLRYSHAVPAALPSTQDDGSSETTDVVGLVG
jgi:hypothetical protein